MNTKMMTLCLILMSWGALAQHDHSQHAATEQKVIRFKDAKLDIAYKHYLQLKDALVASKFDEAKNAAVELKKSLAQVSKGKTALEASAKVVDAASLNDQRKAFSLLSNEMASLVKGGQLSDGVLYLEYCPMANGNEGAYWLSNEKEIRNPYFGDMMLRCGSVKETIQ